jgi:hypothetical protein
MTDEREYPLPEWAIAELDGSCLPPGAQLPTKDGRRTGNAHVIEVIPGALGVPTLFRVLTDAGTEMKLTVNEVDELFHRPRWQSDVGDVERKFRSTSNW